MNSFIAIMRDGVDPDFLANLSRLGQVAVPKPGTSFEKARCCALASCSVADLVHSTYAL